MIVCDPFQRKIHLPVNLCADKKNMQNQERVYEDVTKVVETPSCIIEMPNEKLFYIRSLAANFILLIEAVCRQQVWYASNCIQNPSPHYIQFLLNNGTFIPGSSID